MSIDSRDGMQILKDIQNKTPGSVNGFFISSTGGNNRNLIKNYRKGSNILLLYYVFSTCAGSTQSIVGKIKKNHRGLIYQKKKKNEHVFHILYSFPIYTFLSIQEYKFNLKIHKINIQLFFFDRN